MLSAILMLIIFMLVYKLLGFETFVVVFLSLIYAHLLDNDDNK